MATSLITQGEAIQQAVDAGLTTVTDITRWVQTADNGGMLRHCSSRSVASATRQMVRAGTIAWPEPVAS